MKIISAKSYTSHQVSFNVALVRLALGFARHWLFILNLLLFIWVGLPWLAPVFMHWDWTRAAQAIYFFYSLQCHLSSREVIFPVWSEADVFPG